MSNSGVEKMDIELLSNDDSDRPTHMFRVNVHFKNKDTVLNSGFWPECVGYRHYFYKKKMDTSKKPREQTIQTIMDNLLRIATFNCEGINRSGHYMHNYLNESSCDM